MHIHKGKIMQIRVKAQSATRTQFKLKGSRLHAGTRGVFIAARRCCVADLLRREQLGQWNQWVIYAHNSGHAPILAKNGIYHSGYGQFIG